MTLEAAYRLKDDASAFNRSQHAATVYIEINPNMVRTLIQAHLDHIKVTFWISDLLPVRIVVVTHGASHRKRAERVRINHRQRGIKLVLISRPDDSVAVVGIRATRAIRPRLADVVLCPMPNVASPANRSVS